MIDYCGTTYWITGLSGAGKTTVGKALYEYLHSKENNVVWLDGDLLRIINGVEGYSAKSRKDSAFVDTRWCKLLNEQGIDVVISVMNMFDDIRLYNREMIKNYKEIYLKVSIEELIKRDQKGLYSRALRNEIDNVMGINLEFEEPKTPDLVIENMGLNSPEKALELIKERFDI